MIYPVYHREGRQGTWLRHEFDPYGLGDVAGLVELDDAGVWVRPIEGGYVDLDWAGLPDGADVSTWLEHAWHLTGHRMRLHLGERPHTYRLSRTWVLNTDVDRSQPSLEIDSRGGRLVMDGSSASTCMIKGWNMGRFVLHRGAVLSGNVRGFAAAGAWKDPAHADFIGVRQEAPDVFEGCLVWEKSVTNDLYRRRGSAWEYLATNLYDEIQPSFFDTREPRGAIKNPFEGMLLWEFDDGRGNRNLYRWRAGDWQELTPTRAPQGRALVDIDLARGHTPVGESLVQIDGTIRATAGIGLMVGSYGGRVRSEYYDRVVITGRFEDSAWQVRHAKRLEATGYASDLSSRNACTVERARGTQFWFCGDVLLQDYTWDYGHNGPFGGFYESLDAERPTFIDRGYLPNGKRPAHYGRYEMWKVDGTRVLPDGTWPRTRVTGQRELYRAGRTSYVEGSFSVEATAETREGGYQVYDATFEGGIVESRVALGVVRWPGDDVARCHSRNNRIAGKLILSREGTASGDHCQQLVFPHRHGNLNATSFTQADYAEATGVVMQDGLTVEQGVWQSALRQSAITRRGIVELQNAGASMLFTIDALTCSHGTRLEAQEDRDDLYLSYTGSPITMNDAAKRAILRTRWFLSFERGGSYLPGVRPFIDRDAMGNDPKGYGSDRVRLSDSGLVANTALQNKNTWWDIGPRDYRLRGAVTFIEDGAMLAGLAFGVSMSSNVFQPAFGLRCYLDAGKGEVRFYRHQAGRFMTVPYVFEAGREYVAEVTRRAGRFSFSIGSDVLAADIVDPYGGGDFAGFTSHDEYLPGAAWTTGPVWRWIAVQDLI